MRTIYRFFLVLIACAALLLGVQWPNFIDQYEKRLDAHLIEVEINLRNYQAIADEFFNGSLAALIDKHEQSSDTVFRAEAKPLRILFERHRHFVDQKRGMDTVLAGKFTFLVAQGDRGLLQETWNNYSFSVPLDGAALSAGIITMILVVLVMELLRMTIGKLFGLSHPPQAKLRV